MLHHDHGGDGGDDDGNVHNDEPGAAYGSNNA